jgi:putative membrane protein insertion efficiency factor
MRRALLFLWKLPQYLLIACVRLYQITLSPFLGQQCRFQPTCSHYFIGAVEKHGAVRGSLQGAWRICRCNPWCQGGYDPP